MTPSRPCSPLLEKVNGGLNSTTPLGRDEFELAKRINAASKSVTAGRKDPEILPTTTDTQNVGEHIKLRYDKLSPNDVVICDAMTCEVSTCIDGCMSREIKNSICLKACHGRGVGVKLIIDSSLCKDDEVRVDFDEPQQLKDGQTKRACSRAFVSSLNWAQMLGVAPKV
ncbi:hypothetical protein GIB67_022544 [Kingdonia uniflora]|uniref:Uncharacterized protein n=1 Tax=Kingdonia uniflora TaxID=39325 RepID=A0A7J7L7G9_9MAGN|nr:hypothetical protein GIB67_022544 [Kingdonia uniflora]